MARVARPLRRNPPNPSPANSRPAPAPSPARRPDEPPRAAQDTACPTCGNRRDLRNTTRCKCKQAPEHAQNKVHHANDAVLKTKGISRLDSSHKYRMHRSSGSGGTYSKPDARVKLIPAEDIIGQPFGRTVGSAGSQKMHCGRSVTPPPSSRKVSLVGSTSLNQKPTPPASPTVSCLSLKRLVGDCITGSHTTQIASFKKRTSPSCKAVLSSPSGTSLVNDATVSKNLSRTGSRGAFVRSCSSSVLQCQVQSSAIPPVGLLKESVINPISPSSVHVLAAHSSESPLGSNAEPSSKLVCAPDNGMLCSTAPVVQKEPTVKPTLLSRTSVLSEWSNQVHQDTISRPSGLHLFDRKCNLASLQHETTIPQTQSPQSTPPVQCVELSNDLEAVPSTKSPISNEKQINQEASINCNISSETVAPVILHTKLHKKHYQPEACWKGKFEVIGKLTHTCDGLEAYFPFEIFIKVYEASKQMPEILKLEALPLSRLWPKIFKMKPPDGQDIGLCFISSLQRPNRNFEHLLENTSHIGLRANIGTMELLIFSSKLLTQDYQMKSGKLYFWGVFRKHLRKKQHRSNNHTNNVINNATLSNGDTCDRSEEIGMSLDLTEGREAKSDKCGIGTKLDTTGGEEMVRYKSKEFGKILDVTGNKQIEWNNHGEIGIKLDLTGDNETDRVNKCLPMLNNATLSNGDTCDRSEEIGMNLDLTEGKEAKSDKCEIGTKLDTTGGEEMGRCKSKEIGKILDVTGNKQIERNNHGEIGIKLDLTGDNETDRVNKCLAMLKTPYLNAAASCAAPAAASVGRSCSPNSADSPCQSATRAPAGSYFVLGTTPWFPLDVPPGFTKDHCLLHTGETAEPYIDSFPSLGLDTPPGFPLDIPPGFTEAHRRLPTITSVGAEADVSTPGSDFSLNVTMPVQTEVPPGFTRLLAVKEEPGLPVVYKATEKITPIRKVDEVKIKHKVKVEVEESSEEREFRNKTTMLSDMLGFSPAPSDENTSTLSKCTPRNCTEVRRSITVPSADKFQMGAPEKQKHHRKRGQQEPPEPSAADTTKRLKVDGRITLKNGVARRAFDSNQRARE